MSVFANVAALAKGLYLKQKFTTLGVYLWKKLCFLTGLQKKITYFIVILKSLGAIAL